MSKKPRSGNPPGERYSETTSLAPRIYEGGGPRSGRGSSPAAVETALSVTASPCQLPQRGSRGRFAPFLPPAFMRGEGHAVAGGVPRGGGESLLSHGFAVPAPPEGKPRELRSVPVNSQWTPVPISFCGAGADRCGLFSTGNAGFRCFRAGKMGAKGGFVGCSQSCP